MGGDSTFAEPNQKPKKRTRLEARKSSLKEERSRREEEENESAEVGEEETDGRRRRRRRIGEEEERMEELVCDQAVLDLMERQIEEEREKGVDPDGFQELNVHSFRKLVLQFEKRYSVNQDLRLQFPNTPSKFMDSEGILISFFLLCLSASNSTDSYHSCP